MQKSNFDNKYVDITILHEKMNIKKKMYCSKDKKLLYCLDKFSKKFKKANYDSFYPNFDFIIKGGSNQKLDETKTIEENNIKSGSVILAQEKPQSPSIITLKFKDFSNRKIPRGININHKIKDDFKKLCDSLGFDISNTLLLCKDQKVEIDKKVKDLEYLEKNNNDILTLAQKNPIFKIFIENVPNGADEEHLMNFLQEYQPVNCDIFSSDPEAKAITQYATISFHSQSNALFAIAKCSKDNFQNHKMVASMQDL